MSEENKWGQDPQDTGRTVLTEENALDTNGNADTGSAAETGTDNIDNKPLAHPYSAGRRIQENQRKSTDSSDTMRMEWIHRNMHIIRYISPRRATMQEEAFHRRNHGKPGHPMEMEMAASAEKQPQQFPLQ